MVIRMPDLVRFFHTKIELKSVVCLWLVCADKRLSIYLRLTTVNKAYISINPLRLDWFFVLRVVSGIFIN
jgi:hypothetical protein